MHFLCEGFPALGGRCGVDCKLEADGNNGVHIVTMMNVGSRKKDEDGAVGACSLTAPSSPVQEPCG